MTGRRRWGQAARVVLTVIVTAVLLFPIYWMVVSSLTPQGDLMVTEPAAWPETLTTEHYRHVLADSPFAGFVMNSVKVASAVTLLVMPLAFGGGYALSRFRFRGRRLFGFTLLGTQMLPPIMLAVPLYVTIAALGLVDTHAALVICYATFAVPFAAWMLRGFFDGLPGELEDSARIDGCGRWGVMWRIVLPLAAPGLAATAILAFLLAWNEYLFAMLFINSEQLKTFPVGVTMFMSRWRVDYGALMAASVMVSVPVAVLFLVLQRWLVTGLTAGAVKG